MEGLAQRIVDGDVPETLEGRRIVTLDISAMLAGSKYRGEFEERMKGIMAEVMKNPSVILFIDEIHNIIAQAQPRRRRRGKHTQTGAGAR